MELRTTNRGTRAFFTEAGLAALRLLVLDRRALDLERFGASAARAGAHKRERAGRVRPCVPPGPVIIFRSGIGGSD